MKKSTTNTKLNLNNFQNFEIKKEDQMKVKGGTIIEEILQF
jgi:hypothetical protein